MSRSLTCILLFFFSFGHAQVTFYRQTNGPFYDDIYSFLPTADSGFIACYYGMNLWKFDKDGEIDWTKLFVNSQFPSGYCTLISTNDGGYLLTGITGYTGYSMLKLDSSGDTLWTKHILVNQPTGLGKFIQTSDGGYAMISSCQNTSNMNLSACLIRMDSIGDTLWVKTYRYPFYQTEGIDLVQTPDRGFTLMMVTSAGCFLMKTDSTGSTAWTKEVGTFNRNIVRSSDGGYFLFGRNDEYLTKTDSAGTVLWSRYFADNNWGGVGGVASVVEEPDGKLTICGSTSEYQLPDNPMHAFLGQLSATGNQVWSVLFEIPDSAAIAAFRNHDNGFFLCGAKIWMVGNYFFVKTDSLGNAACATYHAPLEMDSVQVISTPATIPAFPLPSAMTFAAYPVQVYSSNITISTQCISTGMQEEKENQVAVFPNPVVDILNISMDGEKIRSAEIFNILGEKIASVEKNNSEEIVFDCSQFTSGIYWVRLRTENGIIAQKFLKD